MLITLIVFGLATGLVTFLGGMFSLKFRDQAHLITSFSAGVVIGLAFFDLMPESLELFTGGIYGLESTKIVTTIIAIGFILYLILDRLFHNNNEISNHDHSHESHIEHGHRGILRALSLIVHSFLDGVGIGFAFQVSTGVGLLVAVAVLVHDFSDGINTVSAIVKLDLSGSTKIKAVRYLLLDSLAPIFGVLFTLFFTVSANVLGIILALFCGFFFYIGASDLIPESYHNHPTKLTTFMTILGMLFLFVAVTIAG